MIFCGGVGRRRNAAGTFVGYIVLEIVGAPLFIWSRVRIAK
jgi:hypothetical protein